MANYKLIGRNYQSPDIVAKVTGRAKFAEDFRADGMLFCKLLVSPMPHCRVRRIDASAALAMPGVAAILTADDVAAPAPERAQDQGAQGAGQGVSEDGASAAPSGTEEGLTNEPLYEGEPILALAAEDETIAADAIEKIKLDLEPLPFVLDPLESLRPTGPNARLEGNTRVGSDFATIKWTEDDFAELARGRMPIGHVSDEFTHGDLDAGFAQADLTLDEDLFIPSFSHQPLETRSAMAYWQNGKVYVHCSTQSTAQTVGPAARYAGVRPEDVVLVAEYCGGGFGSKYMGSVQMRIPIMLAKKTGRPVMMRVTRQEENFFGRARPGMQGRVRIGFRKDGRITAMDLFLVMDAGPYLAEAGGDYRTAATMASLSYQPLNMRMRGIAVYTNTMPRGAQRGPGGVQAATMLAPVLAKAAKRLGLDHAEMIRVNAPEGLAKFGPAGEDGQQPNVSSAFVREALDKGVEIFGWEERKRRSGQRRGTKITGVGAAVSVYAAGSNGFDGLVIIRPDGRLQIQSGIGNLGTGSFGDTPRVAAEALDMPWQKVEVVWGDSSRHLPWSALQGGSQTTHAHTRANWAAGLDAKRKLQEIAARDFGGSPDNYEVANERVYRKGNPAQGMTFARAAERAIELGGKYDGHELPEDINGMTKRSATALAGRGLMGVAKDNFPVGGRNMSFVIGFAEVEVDVETGAVTVVDYAASADCGTILNPRGLAGQVVGGGIQGLGVAIGQRWVYDPQWGLSVAKRFYSNRPPTILDVPHDHELRWAAAELPDPFNPVGSKGIGEAPQGAGSAAVLCAIQDALGDDYFYRTPVNSDQILTKLEGLTRPFNNLAAHV
jgi:CO/xanthine dehydrogenase Mo-binding subunit